MSDWISVDERMPADFESVLGVCVAKRDKGDSHWYEPRTPYIVIASYHRGRWEGYQAELRITHWRPLPLPPMPEAQRLQLEITTLQREVDVLCEQRADLIKRIDENEAMLRTARSKVRI